MTDCAALSKSIDFDWVANCPFFIADMGGIAKYIFHFHYLLWSNNIKRFSTVELSGFSRNILVCESGFRVS